MIELSGVFKSFENHEVIYNVSLSLKQGEGLAIVGPSGTGKSTLLKIMSGLVSPDKGTVLIEGKGPLSAYDMMGMLFQKNALFDSMSAIDNVAFALRERQAEYSQEPEILKKSKNLLYQVGLESCEKLYPSEMSGGMQKRLGIARALALNPRIIFYDDPTAGLDPITSKKIIDLIKEQKAQKSMTMVLVTNDMNRAYQAADKIAFMFPREFLVTGTPQETMRHPDPRVQQFIKGEVEGPLAGGALD